MNDKEKKIEICENCKIKDTCSNRILTHMEKCKVEDCEYYCEVIDGEKEIEEIAKVIESTEFDWYVQEGTSLQDWVKMHAQALYNAGYRNVKDKVVLDKTRLEYKNKNIYLGNKHIGHIDFSYYDDIKSLGLGDFEIFNKRKGFGTLVCQDIVARYRDKYDLIYCFVDKENIGAIEFYKKVGKVCFDKINDKGQYQVILYENKIKDKVVLDKEEWEVLHNEYAKSLYRARQQARQETAREILNEFGKCKYEKEWYAVWVTLIKKYGIEE